MKKLILTALAALTIGTAAIAQKIDNSKDPRYNSAGDVTNPYIKKDLNKAGEIVSDWYSVFGMVEKSPIGANLSTFVNFLVWDSLGKYIEDDGTIRYGGWQSTGHILDPHDDAIQLTDLPGNQLSRFNSYKLDTIAFRYLYVRNVDSIPDGFGGKNNVVDTLFIAYFKGNQISKRQLVSTGDKLGLVDWNKNTRLPQGYFKMDTILMASAVNGFLDTTRVNNSNGGFENSWGIKLAQFPAPAGVQITASTNGSTSDNLVAFTYTFKSGIKTVIGTDTAVMIYAKDPATIPSGMRRTNYFGCRFAQNAGTTNWDNPKFYNTSLFALKKESYAPTNPGWNGYVSGNAFTSELFLESYFHLTTFGPIGVGIEETENVNITSIFPNPAKNLAGVAFTVKAASKVKVAIFNMVGQEVKSTDFGSVASGSYELPLEISNLKAGIYLVSVTAGNTTHTQKLVVAD